MYGKLLIKFSLITKKFTHIVYPFLREGMLVKFNFLKFVT